jgi:hypothetical protein
MSANAEILIRAFASGWGKGKPPDLGDSVHPGAELMLPESVPYGGGVFRGRDRIAQWFAEDLWKLCRRRAPSHTRAPTVSRIAPDVGYCPPRGHSRDDPWAEYTVHEGSFRARSVISRI